MKTVNGLPDEKGADSGITLEIKVAETNWGILKSMVSEGDLSVSDLVSMVIESLCKSDPKGGSRINESGLSDTHLSLLRDVMEANAAYAAMKFRCFEAERRLADIDRATGAIMNANRFLKEALAEAKQELAEAKAKLEASGKA